jgi:hypothetical protein
VTGFGIARHEAHHAGAEGPIPPVRIGTRASWARVCG